MDEECERELELEREIEEEREVEIPRMDPLKERDWDTSKILQASEPNSLTGLTEIVSLGDFVAEKLQPPGLSRFGWSRDVFGTSNFFQSVACKSGLQLSSLNHYLRIVDVFLCFQNKQVLLVSEREADELIKLLWKHPRQDSKVTLCHLSILRSALDGKIQGLNLNSTILGHEWNNSWTSWRRAPILLACPSDCIVATLQFFAGETMYETSSRHEALKAILRGAELARGPATADPEYIVDARGNSHLFQLSTLEKACRELASEEQEAIREKEAATAMEE